jgi:hypothetical protein
MRQRWLSKKVLLLAVALITVALGPVGHASAAPANTPAPAQGAVAQFEGRSINLGADRGEARACLVLRQGNECFRTPEAMEAREAQLGLSRKPSKGDDGAVTAYSSYSCSSPLRLYDYGWYGGRQLSFWERGFWQNLWLYGFEDRTSSYAVGACYAHLAEHSDGYGWWYPGPTYPWAGEPVMSWGWDNVISSIYIE